MERFGKVEFLREFKHTVKECFTKSGFPEIKKSGLKVVKLEPDSFKDLVEKGKVDY